MKKEFDCSSFKKCMFMKRLLAALIIPVALVFAQLSAPQIHAEEAQEAKEDPAGLRAWKSSTGHEIQAKFLGLKNNIVLLEDADGNKRDIRLALLAPEDQKLAQELQDKQSEVPAAGTEQKASDQLPVFTEGQHKNYHAVYTCPNFVARVRANTMVDIQCMEDGKPIGKPIYLRSYHAYYERKKNTSIGRKIVSFDSVSQPTLSPDRLYFEGLLEDQVKFGFGVEFKGNTIQGWGWVEDPPGIEKPTSYFRYFSVPSSHSFEPHVLVAEQKKILEPYSVTVKPVKGKSTDYPYGDVVERWSTSSSQVTINGPIFGGRKLVFTPETTREGTLRPWIYPRYAPYQGYQVRLSKDKPSIRSERSRIILTIN